MKPKAIVITGYGINCEEETAHAFNLAGAEAEIVHVNDLISGEKSLDSAQILAFAGGFSYGDDTGSGNAMANKLRNNLKEEIFQFAENEQKLVIGICNGFQMLVNLGLLPATEKYGEREAALMHNNTTRYQCRWIHLKNSSKKCIWTRDIDTLHVPIAHGEGNFYAAPEIMEKIHKNDQIAFKYIHQDGTPANGQFPINPNGSMEDIAALCDPSGRIFGIMPHPERFLYFENEEGWELKKEELIRANKTLPTEGAGLQIFKNGVNYFQ